MGKHKYSFIVLLILSLFIIGTANANFIKLYKIGSYFEFLYESDPFTQRFSAKVIGDTVMNNNRYQILRIFNEPILGTRNQFYFLDTASLVLYSKGGYTTGCLDSELKQKVIGFNWGVGYAFNTCFDTLGGAFRRSFVQDTGTFTNIFNSGIPLKAVLRRDTVGGSIQANTYYVFYEMFGFIQIFRNYGNPFNGGWYSITLKGAIIDSVTYGTILLSVKQISSEVPENFFLKQNYPNPFNASTTIEFSLPKTTNVRLKVYDISGKEIVLLFNEKKPPGTYKYLYYANNLSSGVYFYCLVTDYGIQTKRMILLK